MDCSTSWLCRTNDQSCFFGSDCTGDILDPSAFSRGHHHGLQCSADLESAAGNLAMSDERQVGSVAVPLADKAWAESGPEAAGYEVAESWACLSIQHLVYRDRVW